MGAIPDCPHCKGTGKIRSSASAGFVIRAVRDAKGWTLRRLAKAIGVSAPYLCDVEHGRRGIAQGKATEAICTMMGIAHNQPEESP